MKQSSSSLRWASALLGLAALAASGTALAAKDVVLSIGYQPRNARPVQHQHHHHHGRDQDLL
jgi:glutathione transport system substrate-binding protein